MFFEITQYENNLVSLKDIITTYELRTDYLQHIL